MIYFIDYWFIDWLLLLYSVIELFEIGLAIDYYLCIPLFEIDADWFCIKCACIKLFQFHLLIVYYCSVIKLFKFDVGTVSLSWIRSSMVKYSIATLTSLLSTIKRLSALWIRLIQVQPGLVPDQIYVDRTHVERFRI